jgi:hypothetical protein
VTPILKKIANFFKVHQNDTFRLLQAKLPKRRQNIVTVVHLNRRLFLREMVMLVFAENDYF